MSSYISSQGLNWRGLLKGFPKVTNAMQPLFEAFTNSLEAIDMRKKKGEEFSPYIHVDFHFNQTLEGGRDGLTRMIITDNGIGFDDDNYKRLKVFKDDMIQRAMIIEVLENSTYTLVCYSELQ